MCWSDNYLYLRFVFYQIPERIWCASILSFCYWEIISHLCDSLNWICIQAKLYDRLQSVGSQKSDMTWQVNNNSVSFHNEDILEIILFSSFKIETPLEINISFYVHTIHETFYWIGILKNLVFFFESQIFLCVCIFLV